MSIELESKIQKWGTGLGLRISGVVRDVPQFSENTPITVEVFEQGFTVRKRKTENAHLPISERQLLDGLDEQQVHADLVVDIFSDEWGE